MTTPVLMYHAVGDDVLPAQADRHYAVSGSAFRDHMASIAGSGLRAGSMRSLLSGAEARGVVAVTFDDGDASNAEAAACIAAHGGSADFFVNPANVGKTGFRDWQALADMARQGFSIQSHGLTHRYFNEMDEATIAHELRASKAAIEDHVGQPVTLFAPPGGRLAPSVPRIAAGLGYAAICSSRAGVWDPRAGTWDIPRFAVLATTDAARFERWIRQDARELARMRLRQLVLDGMKRLLGNRRYERLRHRALGSAEPR